MRQQVWLRCPGRIHARRSRDTDSGIPYAPVTRNVTMRKVQPCVLVSQDYGWRKYNTRSLVVSGEALE